MIYKISEIGKELGVSRQTVYKKIRRAEFRKYLVDLNGTKGVTEEGLQMLKNIQCKEIESDNEFKPYSKVDTHKGSLNEQL